MSLQRKEYLCQVTIVEGRELSGTDPSGSCDPFVKVTCGNAQAQATTTEDQTNNPSWNQSFTFSKLSLTDSELESWELKIECMDFNAFMTNKLIGAYSVGLATLNRNSNHEFYNMWVVLLHPEYGSTPRGYLLINCFIVGPDDVPPAHAIGEQMGLDEDAEDSDDDADELLTPEQRKFKKLKKQAIGTVKTPMIAKKNYQLSVNCYKADKIVRFGGNESSPFVSVRTQGIVERTHVIDANSNPIWNIKLSFPVSTPILNDRITIRVWDYRPRSRDKLVATLPEVPNDHDYYNISNLISRGGVLPCRWCNLYGPSEEEDTIWNDIRQLTGFSKKSYIGTCFVGRLLLSMTVSPNDEPETGVAKAAPYREPLSKIHQLKVTIYEMKNAGACGDKVRVRVSIGQHFVFSKASRKKEKVDTLTKEPLIGFTWGSSYSGELLQEIKEPFPVDPTQTPDVFVDLYSEGFTGEKRIGYIRKPVTEIIGNDSPLWIPFRSIDQHSNVGMASPGLLLICMFFGVESEENNRGPKLKPRKVEHWLCWNIFGGLDMAPALEDADTNIFIKIYCGECVIPMPEKLYKDDGKDKKDNNKMCGKFPIWKWADVKELNLHEDLHFEQNMRIEVHNNSKILGLIKTTDEIGQFSIPLYACAQKWSSPHFFHVVNSNELGVSQGRIIASFYVSREKIDSDRNPCAESMETRNCDIEVALIGIRGLRPPYEELKITLEIPGYSSEGKPAFEVITPPSSKDKSNPNIQEIICFKGIDLPVKPIYLPAIYVKIEDTALLSWNKSFTYISLIKYCDWIDDELEKRDAIEQYQRNFTEKDLIEQAPVNISPEEAASKRKLPDVELITDYGSDEGCNEDDEEDISKVKRAIPFNDIFEPKNSKIFPRIEFDKSKVDEDSEIELREKTQKKLEHDLETTKEIAKQRLEKKGEVPEDIKRKIRELERELEVVNMGVMSENAFLKKDDDFEEEGDYQYNRPIYKNGLLDDIQTPPYHRFQLFKKSKNSDKLSIFRVGEPTGAILKAVAHIKFNDPNAEKYPNVDNLKWKFNFFHPVFRGDTSLIKAFSGMKVVIRVYLLRALSLCAVDNASDLPAIAAGLEALSSATSYPELQIGEEQIKNVTYFIEEGNPEKDNLNPEYFRSYEMHGELPSDWRLAINIWSQGSMGFDRIIGSTSIDMEDRYFGNKYISKLLMLNIAKNYVDRIIETTTITDERNWLNSVKKKIKRKLLDLKENRPLVPVEYRPLSAKGKKTAQGMIEMFVEVLDLQTAKLVPMSKIAKPVPEKYELRFIIWKCEGIPIPEGDETVDIFFKVSFDPTGWLAESTDKETDCHAGSEDGHGIFNWRIKFDFELPCSFARIRLAAYDFSTFGDDQMMSEVVLDLAKHFRRVMKEGKLGQEEQWVDLIIPGPQQKNGGKVLVSFTILSLAEANQTPVGEGRDEPNRDPELETPEEGRGITDFLKGTPLDVSSWSLFNFGLIKKLIMLLSLVGTVVVLFIYPGLISKPA